MISVTMCFCFTFNTPLHNVRPRLCALRLIHSHEERHQKRPAALPLQGLWPTVQREEWNPLRRHEVQGRGGGLNLPPQVQLPSLRPGGLRAHGGAGPSHLKEHGPLLADRFHAIFQGLQRRYRPEYFKVWHIDELHVRLRGEKGYVYVVEDDRRNIVAMELTERSSGEIPFNN